MKKTDKSGELLNDYQKKKLTEAETTLEENLWGGNIDQRGADIQLQREGMEGASAGCTDLNDDFIGKGGELIKGIDQGQLIQDDFGNEV